MMQNRQNYRTWKWRALVRRRPFYFNLLQVFLALEWLGIHFNLSRPNLSPDSEENQQRPFRNLPFIFFLIHAFTFIVIFFFSYGKSLLQHASGKRLCEWSSFSLVSVAFCLVLLNTHDAEDHVYNTSFVSFSVTSAIGFLILHHLGIAEPIIVFIKGCILIIWIYYLSISVSCSVCGNALCNGNSSSVSTTSIENDPSRSVRCNHGDFLSTYIWILIRT